MPDEEPSKRPCRCQTPQEKNGTKYVSHDAYESCGIRRLAKLAFKCENLFRSKQGESKEKKSIASLPPHRHTIPPKRLIPQMSRCRRTDSRGYRCTRLPPSANRIDPVL